MSITPTEKKDIIKEFMRIHPELGAKPGEDNAVHNSTVFNNAEWAVKGIEFTMQVLFLKHDKAIADADTVARLEEEIKNSKSRLMKSGYLLSDEQRRELSQRIISYEKILTGDKPDDPPK